MREPKERQPPWNPKKKENPNLIKTKDDSIFYIKRKDGIWFEAKLKDSEFADSYYSPFVIHNPEWIAELIGKYTIGSKKVSIRTLSKKEKKKLKLN